MKNNKIYKEIQNAISENFYLYPNSLRTKEDVVFFILKDNKHKYLGIAGPEKKIDRYNFSERQCNSIQIDKESSSLIKFFKRNEINFKILTEVFPELLPVPIGSSPSFGFGDRLGNANAAHIRIIKQHEGIIPVLAQQSVRELEKTKKDFEKVISNSVWNIMQDGYKGVWAADADHIKDMESFIKAAEAGMTMYTLDTAEHLDEKVLFMDLKKIKENYNLDTDYIKYLKKKYLDKKIKIGKTEIIFSSITIFKLAILYGKALSFIKEIFLFLSSRINSFDYEVSFDETNTITSPEAHYFLANEMLDSGIKFTSIALRFPGTFEKGIDYLGEIKEFESSIRIHSFICRKIGGYKLSLHSGSDKLSIYPSFTRHTNGVFHIKTSGTSWLEAIRLVASKDSLFFRKLYKIAYDSFDENKKAYHVNLDKKTLPLDLNKVSDTDLPSIVDNKDLRRVFHIGYGTILDEEKGNIMRLLFENEEKYYQYLIENFKKHFDAFKC